ncbi:MAG: hypothetical protein ACLQD8_00645 [Thermoplasmata archaeon]
MTPPAAPPIYDLGFSPPQKSRRLLYVVVSVLAVVAVAVILVLASGVISPPGSSPGVTFGSPLRSSQAISAGNTAKAFAEDGPWTLYSIIGVGTDRSSSSGSTAQSLGEQGCTTVWATSTSSVVPATASGAPAGQVAWWVLGYDNAAGDLLLSLATNLSGTVQVSNLVILSGSCTSVFTKFGPIPASVIDSTTAASTANTAGGSAFLSDYPGSTVDMEMIGEYWVILYSTCGYYGSGGTGTEFEFGIYDTNGTALPGGGTSPTSCS